MDNDPKPTFSHKKAWMGALIGGIAAAILNVIIFYIANAVLDAPLQVAQPGAVLQDLDALTVITASIVPAIGAGVVMSALGKWAKKPGKVFMIIAIIFFLLSLSGPLQLEISGGAQAWLVLMHIVAAVLITKATVMKGMGMKKGMMMKKK